MNSNTIPVLIILSYEFFLYIFSNNTMGGSSHTYSIRFKLKIFQMICFIIVEVRLSVRFVFPIILTSFPYVAET